MTTYTGHIVPRFPARVLGSGLVTVTKSGLNYTFGWSMDGLSTITNVGDGKTRKLLLRNETDGIHEVMTPQNLFAAAEIAVQDNAVAVAARHTIDFVDNTFASWSATDTGTKIQVSASLNSGHFFLDEVNDRVGIQQPLPSADAILHVGDYASVSSPNSAVAIARQASLVGDTSIHGFSVGDVITANNSLGCNSFDDRSSVEGDYGTPIPGVHRYIYQTSGTLKFKGTLPIHVCYYGQMTLASPTASPGVVTSFNYAQFINPTTDGAGPVTIDTLRGLRIEELTRGTVANLAIETVGATKSAFYGQVNFNSTEEATSSTTGSLTTGGGAAFPKSVLAAISSGKLQAGSDVIFNPTTGQHSIGAATPGNFAGSAAKGLVVGSTSSHNYLSVYGNVTGSDASVFDFAWWNGSGASGKQVLMRMSRSGGDTTAKLDTYIMNAAVLALAETLNGDRSKTLHAGPLTIGTAGTTLGQLKLTRATAANTVTIAPNASTGTFTFTLPSSGGTNTQVLMTDGSGGTSWVDLSSISQYADGTFSPTFVGDGGTAGTFTYTSQIGKYVREGNVVHIWGIITISAISVAPTGNIGIESLPFTARNNGASFQLQTVPYAGIDLVTAGNTLGGSLSSNTSRIALVQSGDNVAIALLAAAALGATGSIRFAGSYQI